MAKSRESVKATIDVAALIEAVSSKIGAAYENGASSGRASVDTLSLALKEAYATIQGLQVRNENLLKLITEAAGANAQLSVLAAQERILTEELRSRGAMIDKVLNAIKGPAEMLVTKFALPAKGATAGGAADRGEKSGRAAVLRLFARLSDNEIAIKMVSDMVGEEDWSLITGFVRELAATPQGASGPEHVAQPCPPGAGDSAKPG